MSEYRTPIPISLIPKVIFNYFIKNPSSYSTPLSTISTLTTPSSISVITHTSTIVSTIQSTISIVYPSSTKISFGVVAKNAVRERVTDIQSNAT
jgi:hypothetical protein